ncbi:uncharacterized protein DFL_008310 [Arthrobotrys flagrans]|uniref:Uncharacterized protein n=1 Tax=Arthrobotrys flagrans TaxID=97331 RepID=A0A436ZNI6_ARTFL|nr:hypothetical protein DFL_008310 [Arthrobotrys flagrans]
MRWARHFFFEINEYFNLTSLELHYILNQWLEPTTIFASLRELSHCRFYRKLVHLTLSFQYKERPPWGYTNWYGVLPKQQQGFLGSPLTKAQTNELIGSSLDPPPALENATLNVSEGLSPDRIYYKFLSMAPNLRDLDIEAWMPPTASLRRAQVMFPNLLRLRVGLKEGFASLPVVLDTIAEQFPGLVSLQLDSFGDWWRCALQGSCVHPESLDCIMKLKNLKSLVMPCPAALGPNKSKMITLSGIYRLCPQELNDMLEKWYESGMKLETATFDGYLVHPKGTLPESQYFELSCVLGTKLAVNRTHSNKLPQSNALAAHGLVPCSTESGLFKNGGLLGQRAQHLRHLRLHLELQSIRAGITDALVEVLTQLYLFPAINKLSVTFVAHRDSERTLFLTAFRWISQCSFYHNVRSLFLETEICDTQISAQDRKDWYSKCQQRDQLFLQEVVQSGEAIDVIPPLNLQEAIISISPQRIGKQLPYYHFLSKANRLERLVINNAVTFPKDFEAEEEGRKWNSCVPTPIIEPTVPNAPFYGVKSLTIKITGYPFGRKLKRLAECFPDLEELDLVLDETRYRTAVINPDTFIQTYDGLLGMKKLKAISIPWPKLKDPNCPPPLRNTFRKTLGKWMADDQTDSDMRMLGIEELEKWVLYWQQCQLPLEKVQFNGWKPVGQWHSVRKWVTCTVDKYGGPNRGRKSIWEECDPTYGRDLIIEVAFSESETKDLAKILDSLEHFPYVTYLEIFLDVAVPIRINLTLAILLEVSRAPFYQTLKRLSIEFSSDHVDPIFAGLNPTAHYSSDTNLEEINLDRGRQTIAGLGPFAKLLCLSPKAKVLTAGEFGSGTWEDREVDLNITPVRMSAALPLCGVLTALEATMATNHFTESAKVIVQEFPNLESFVMRVPETFYYNLSLNSTSRTWLDDQIMQLKRLKKLAIPWSNVVRSTDYERHQGGTFINLSHQCMCYDPVDGGRVRRSDMLDIESWVANILVEGKVPLEEVRFGVWKYSVSWQCSITTKPIQQREIVELFSTITRRPTLLTWFWEFDWEEYEMD